MSYKINQREYDILLKCFDDDADPFIKAGQTQKINSNVSIHRVVGHPVFVAELIVKNDNPAFLRHLFHKVLGVDLFVFWIGRTFDWPLTESE
jgi:hypothetical protein